MSRRFDQPPRPAEPTEVALTETELLVLHPSEGCKGVVCLRASMKPAGPTPLPPRRVATPKRSGQAGRWA